MATQAPSSVTSSTSVTVGKESVELRWWWTKTSSLRIDIHCPADDVVAGRRQMALKALEGWIAPEKWLNAAWDLEQNRSELSAADYETKERKLRKRLMKKIPKAAKKEIRQIEKLLLAL